MLLMNIILAACFAPIWPVMYFIIRYLAKPMKLIVLGVTLPQSAHDDTRVKAITGGFRKWLNITTLPLLPLLALPFFMTSMGAAMFFYMLWMTVLIVLPFVVFAVHREKLMTLKHEECWYSDASDRTLVDIKAAAVPAKKINSIWFLPAVAIGIFPVVYTFSTTADWAMMSLYITFAVTTLLFWPFYYLIFRQRAEVVNENLTLTMALTRVRRYNWGKFWIVATWSTGVLNLLLWALESYPMALMYLTIGYSLVVLVVAMRTEFATRRAQKNLISGDTGTLYLDEDDHWIWGMFYNNPNDNHFMVNNRVGMGMTVNMAKLGGKILMGFAALVIIAMPFLGVWIWIEEATPVSLVLSETELIVRHTSDRYVIPLRSIDSVELREQRSDFPYILARTSGASFENLRIGRFSVLGHGSTFLCVHPNDPPYLIIVADGQAYILNDADSNVTRDVYALVR